MALTQSQLETKRDALISQMATATERLQSGDKSVSFQSIQQMERALAVLDGELARVTGTAPSRIVRIYTGSI